MKINKAKCSLISLQEKQICVLGNLKSKDTSWMGMVNMLNSTQR